MAAVRPPGGRRTISFKYQFHGCWGGGGWWAMLPRAVRLAGLNPVRKGGHRQRRARWPDAGCRWGPCPCPGSPRAPSRPGTVAASPLQPYSGLRPPYLVQASPSQPPPPGSPQGRSLRPGARLQARDSASSGGEVCHRPPAPRPRPGLEEAPTSPALMPKGPAPPPEGTGQGQGHCG